MIARERTEVSEALRLIGEGNAKEDAGLLDEALQCYDQAIVLAPEVARGYLNRGNVLLAKGDAAGALDAYASALAREPDNAGAHFNMGNACARVGDHEAALAAYRRAIALNADFADAELAMGNVLEGLDRSDEAVASYRRAAQIAPASAEALYNLSIALRRRGLFDEAEATLRLALTLRPGYAEAHVALGSILEDHGRLEDAAVRYRTATEISPAFAQAHYQLGLVLQKLSRYDAAVTSFERALQIRPDYTEAHYNLSIPLRMQGRLDEAEASLRRVLALAPENVEANTGLGMVLEELMRTDEAEASYRRALAIAPDFLTAYNGLLFCLSHDERMDPAMLFDEHRRFGKRFDRLLRRQHDNDHDPERMLQVGFVSGDLRSHAVASFFEPVLVALAGRPGMTLHAYYNRAVEDDVTARLRSHFRHWHRVAGLTDEALAQKIAADGIDILVDLSGHTAANRLLTFARKPAPVQASWMGYPGTTGLAAMDYYLGDRPFLPREDFDSQFTEKIVHLPAVAPFLPDETAPPVNVLPALARGFVTFGSFNRPSKLSRSVVAMWSRLLRELPDSRLLLGGMPQHGDPSALIAWFAAERVARHRLQFHGRCDVPTYLGLHHDVDMCLDTFPYTGGTTTINALWMGVPTLTRCGPTPAGRQGAALLGHLGLLDFVAADADDFAARGVRWARDPAALAVVRAGLRERIQRSPIGRPDVVAAGLARALRTMWQRWCAGLPPQAIDAADPSA